MLDRQGRGVRGHFFSKAHVPVQGFFSMVLVVFFGVLFLLFLLFNFFKTFLCFNPCAVRCHHNKSKKQRRLRAGWLCI
jgi:hypothetical protein